MHDLSPDQERVLTALLEGPMTATEVGVAALVSGVRVLGSLAARGWVVRERDGRWRLSVAGGYVALDVARKIGGKL